LERLLKLLLVRLTVPIFILCAGYGTALPVNDMHLLMDPSLMSAYSLLMHLHNEVNPSLHKEVQFQNERFVSGVEVLVGDGSQNVWYR
jgi:hypothetical protein